MSQQATLVRKSPFVFLRWLVLIEFFFAFLPFVAAILLGVEETYSGTTLASAVPYPLLLTMIMTTLQVLLIILFFLAWYLPVYQLDREQIVYRRGQVSEGTLLARTQFITHVDLQQGSLAQRLDYGTLLVYAADRGEPAAMRDIPNPSYYARLIQDMVEPGAAQPELPEPKPVEQLIVEGENQFVEFKSSLVWDYRQQMANKDLYEPVMKNVVAFMNAAGGTLVIGVNDDGQVLGLERDFSTLRKPNADGWENSFTMAFNKMVGVEYMQYVHVSFPEVDGRQICVVSVRPSQRPAYLYFKGQEQFYIRAGNSSQPLSISKAAQYIQTRFQH